tara:strand:+ start:42 stop:389 length:348 start_codon:yes stop_codon:yes gene_type:complete
MYNIIRKLFWILEIIIIAPIIFLKSINYVDKNIFLSFILLILAFLITIYKTLNISSDQNYKSVNKFTIITFIKGTILGLYLVYWGSEYDDNTLTFIGLSMMLIKMSNITGFTFIT